MKLLLSLALLVLSSTFSVAQDTAAQRCPSISVAGPAGIVGVGELATYTAAVSNADQYSLEYVWTVSAGRIKDGQGTKSVRVIRPNSSLVVSVEVKGLPANCPLMASETDGCGLVAPDPVKIYELQPNAAFNKAAAMNVAQVMLENPNNQLYILAGDVRRQNSPSFQQKQRSISALLVRYGITPERITIASVYSDVELFQFWRVPPGASSPACEECNELEQEQSACPNISVTGPAGVVEPGEDIIFVTTISGTIPKQASYDWTIDNGTVVSGQGTPRLIVHDKRQWGGRVTATVTISGLPHNCSQTASEDYVLVVDPGPEELGAVDNSTHTIGKELLAKIGDSLRESPSSQLYVWVYVGSDRAKFPRIKARLLQQLSVTNIDPSRFTIEGTSVKGQGAAFWLIRPGVSNPNP